MIQDCVSVPGVTNPFGMGYLFNPYAAYAANGAAQLVSTATISYSWLCLWKMSRNTNAQTSLNWAISFKFTKLSSFCGETKLDWRAFVLIYEKISPILCKFQSGRYLKRDKPEEIQTFLFYSPSLETIKQ